MATYVHKPGDLEGLRRIGRIVGLTLLEMQRHVRPGVSTGELDAIAATTLAQHGARPTPKHQLGFPGSSCISVNDEITHGVPGSRILAVGDVVKLDVTADLAGHVVDAARTVVIPPVRAEIAKMVFVARSAFDLALQHAVAGRLIRAVGRAVEGEARRFGYKVCRELTGHGVGRRIHELPEIYNYDEARCMGRFVEGMVVAIEPILTLGSGRTLTAPDKWTIVTADRAVAVHHEETLVITREAPIILTQVVP